MDQASFPGFAEADAHRPIEVDLSHHCAERPSLTGVPKIDPGGLSLHVRGGHAVHIADQDAGLLGGLAEGLPSRRRLALALQHH